MLGNVILLETMLRKKVNLSTTDNLCLDLIRNPVAAALHLGH